MAEEFQAGICAENWWSCSNINSTRSVFPMMSSSSSPYSVAGNYSTWQTDFMDLKATRSCSDHDQETNINLVSENSLGFLDHTQKPHHSESVSGTGSSISIDPTLQMMGFRLSSSTSSNWNKPIFGRPAESNFHSATDSSDSQIPKRFSSGTGESQVSTIDMNQEFSLDHHRSLSNSVTSNELSSCGFPIGSASSYGYSSTLIQSLLYDPQLQPQPQHSLFTNPSSMSYSSSTPNNYGTEPSPTWSTISSLLKPKQHHVNGFHFSNNTPFWNASAEALNDNRAAAFASSQLNRPTTQLHNKVKSEESPDTASVVKKSVCEPVLKRPRIETPSPLPTFKVRKEKLGDRITALQQLVSPFGKTDTASVLHEAIEYIKFLHDQVNVLSTPYMRNGAPIEHQQGCDDVNESEGTKQDLRSRGLCLVPISSTFPVAHETTVDFWTPTFGGAVIR